MFRVFSRCISFGPSLGGVFRLWGSQTLRKAEEPRVNMVGSGILFLNPRVQDLEGLEGLGLYIGLRAEG